MGRPRHPGPLTPAEQRVLEHLRLGQTNAEIAVRLGLSVNTVKYHVANMLDKLGLDDRQGLARWDGQRRTGRGRTWLITGGLGVALITLAAAAAGGLLWLRRSDQVQEASEGTSQTTTNRALQTTTDGTLPIGVLAFVSYDPDASQAELHLLRADAPEPSKLYVPPEKSMIFSPVWSPDGSRIALIVADSGKLPLKPGESSLGHVWMVDAASGATQLVSRGGAWDASLSPLAGVVEYPAWRPDGGAVAYVTQDFITTVRPLNEDHPSDQMLGCVSPRWSPRRGGACAVTRSGGEFDISEGDYNDVFRPEVRYDLYPGIPTTGQAPSWLLGLGGLNAYPAFSPDGHWLAWSHRDAGASTIVASPPGDPVLDQNKDIAGYRRPDKVEPGPGLRPEWAPTGLRLAFSDGLPGWFRQLLGATHVGDTAGEIWLYDAETRTRKNLSIHPANDSFPAWSPDGRWIAFVSDRDDPLGEIYVVRTDGTGLRRLTHNHRAEAQPAWRPE